jgi:hypothetical protein
MKDACQRRQKEDSKLPQKEAQSQMLEKTIAGSSNERMATGILKGVRDGGFSSLRAVSFLPIPQGNGSPERTNYEQLTADNAAVLLVDHQVGLFTGVVDIDVLTLKHNVVALARAARLLGVPTIVTATVPDGM